MSELSYRNACERARPFLDAYKSRFGDVSDTDAARGMFARAIQVPRFNDAERLCAAVVLTWHGFTVIAPRNIDDVDYSSANDIARRTP